MGNIISWYNRNRKRIWVTILAVVVIWFIVFKLWDIINQNSRDMSAQRIQNSNSIDTNQFNTITMPSQNSVITGRNISTSQEELNTLDSFINLCNTGKIQEAYNLLSDECKEEMYQTVNKFKEYYYDSYFEGKTKNVKIENWVGNTYMVKINEDALSTGKYGIENTLQDYITIVKDKEEKEKLNINNYIGRTTFNQTQTSYNVQIKLLQKDSYMDYEYYTIEALNNTENTIALGDQQNLEATYLLDKNEMKYNGVMTELSQAQLIVPSKSMKKIKIKYFNRYSSTRKITNLIFPKIIYNYNRYKEVEDYNNYIAIKFDL